MSGENKKAIEEKDSQIEKVHTQIKTLCESKIALSKEIAKNAAIEDFFGIQSSELHRYTEQCGSSDTLRRQLADVRLYVEKFVRKSPDYWPEGFEAEGGGSLAFKMSFLFCKDAWIRKKFADYPQKLNSAILNQEAKKAITERIQAYSNSRPDPEVSIFPPNCVEFWSIAINANNFFNKKDKTDLPSFSYYLDYQGQISIGQGNYFKAAHDVTYTDPLTRFDPYIENPQFSPAMEHLYKAIFDKRCQEEDIAPLAQKKSKEEGAFSSKIDEWKRVLALRSCRETQVIQTLSYFRDNAECLDNPEWIRLFHSLLFEGDCLLEEIGRSRETLHLLREFFGQGIQNAVSLENMPRAMNLLWLASRVERFVGHIDKQEHVLSFETLQKVVTESLDKKFAAHRGQLADTLLAVSANLAAYEKNPEKKVQLMVYQQFGLIMKNQKGPKKTITQRNSDVAEATEGRCERFDKLSLDHQNKVVEQLIPFLNKFFDELSLDSKQGANNIGMQQFSLPPDVTLDLAGGYITKGQALLVPKDQPIPQEFLVATKICELLSQEELEACTSAFVTPTNRREIIISDPVRKREIYCNSLSGRICIKSIETGNQWFSYVPKWEAVDLRPKEYFKKFDVAQRESTVHFYDHVTGKLLYEINEGRLTSLEFPELCLSEPKDQVVQALAEHLARFEDKNFILLWGKQGQPLSRIELPRHNLSFQQTAKGFECDQMKGWCLASEQYVAGITCQEGFLVLENSDTKQRKVLFPEVPATGHDIQEAKDHKQVLFLPYQHNLNAVSDKTEMKKNEYEIDSSGEVTCKTFSERYFLANVYLVKGELTKAEGLLFSNQAECTFRPYTKDEVDLICQILRTPIVDIYSRVARFQVHLAYLLLRNVEQFPPQDESVKKMVEALLSEASLKKLQDTFQAYLKALPHLKACDALEEKIVLCSISKGVDTLQGRLIELTTGTAPVDENLPPSFEARTQAATELGRAENVTPHLYDIMTCKVPVLSRIKYWVAKQFKNSFPFDPTHIEQLSQEKRNIYLRLLLEECDSLTVPRAIDRGVYQALHYFHLSDKKQLQSIGDLGLHAVINKHKYSGGIFKSYERRLRLDESCERENAKRNQRSPQPVNLQKTVENTLVWFMGPVSLAVEKKYAERKTEAPAKVKEKRVPSHPVSEKYDLSFLKLAASSDLEQGAPQIANTFFDKKEEVVGVKDDPMPEKMFPSDFVEAQPPSSKREFERQKEDMKVALQPHVEAKYSLKDGMEVEEIQTALTERIEEETKKCSVMQETIEETISHIMQSTERGAFELESGKRKPLTIDELVILAAKDSCAEKIFGDKKPTALRDRIPELTDSGRKKLREAVGQYLAQKQLVQQLVRGSRFLEEFPERLEDFAKVLDARCSYDVEKDNDAMLFQVIEKTLDIRLRQDQVTNIRTLKYAYGKVNEVLQMIMGAGKTSVLQPILGILLARPEQISAVVVPPAQFAAVREALSKTLGAAFDSLLFTVNYDRELAKNPSFLKTYYDKLCEIEKKGGCLLLTPESLHAITTSLYEAYFDGDEERIEMISDIAFLLREKANVQIDEVDLLMNPQVVFKFPVGPPQYVNSERADCVAELVIRLAKDTELLQKISLDFAEKFQKKEKVGGELTPETFLQVVKPKLAGYALEILRGRISEFQKIEAEDTKGYLSHLLNQTTPFDDEIAKRMSPKESALVTARVNHGIVENEDDRLIAQKLSFQKERKEWLEQKIPNKEDRDLLGVLADAISSPSMLPKTLFKSCDAHYGRELKDGKPVSGHYVARPYEAPGKSKSTMYSDPYEQVIHSVQSVLYSGIPRDAAQVMLANLQHEASDEFKQSKKGSVLTTEGYLEFARVMGAKAKEFSFLETHPSDALLSAFIQAISKDEKMLKCFFNDFLFKQISLYSEDISSSPQTMAGCVHSTVAYAGTMHEEILHVSMHANPEVGTDGKTISAVEKKEELGIAGIIDCSKKMPLLEQVKERFTQDKELFVFIDSGGWLKEANIDEYAKELLACRPECNGIVYHDGTGAIISIERDEKGTFSIVPFHLSKLEKHKRLTIIQQQYETGTNIQQVHNAKGFMSVRKDMTLRDFLQSVFRMRQILMGQACYIGLSLEVQNHLRASLPGAIAADGTLDFAAVIRYFTANLSDAKLEKNWDAVRFRAKEVLEKPIREFLHDRKIPVAERRKLFSHFKSFLVSKSAERLFDAVSSPTPYMSAEDACKALEENMLRIYQNFAEMADPALREQFNEYLLAPFPQETSAEKVLEAELKKCSANVPLPEVVIGAMAAGSEMQQQVQQQVQLQQQIELQRQVEVALFGSTIKSAPVSPLATCSQTVEAKQFGIPTRQAQFTTPSTNVFAYDLDAFTKVPDDRSASSHFIDLAPSGLQLALQRYWHQLFVSHNFHPLGRLAPLTSQQSGEQHQKATVLAEIRDEKDPSKKRYMVLSNTDVAAVKNGIAAGKKPEGVTLTLLSIEGEVVASTDSKRIGPGAVDSDTQEILTVSKFLNGNLDYKKEELDVLLKDCKNDQERKERIRELREFFEMILTFQPHAASQYSGSTIYRFLSLGKKAVKP